MAIPVLDTVPSSETLPAAAEVVIIGGGIIGTSAALSLAERRISVVLCEKGRIGAEQSGRNWGWCRKQGRDPRELPLMLESMRQWGRLAKRVGADIGFRETGILYLASTASELASYEAWLGRAQPFQLDSKLIGPAEVANLLPGGTRTWLGALYTRTDGRAEPQKAAPAIARAAAAAGARLLTGCAVRGLEMQAGRVAGVITERGSIRCSAVVLAGGAWSRLFCGSIGLLAAAVDGASVGDAYRAPGGRTGGSRRRT